jgi:hypothetical protein
MADRRPVAFGEFRYGGRSKAVSDGLFGDLTYETLMTYGSVARAVKASIRIEGLSFLHHRKIVGLSTKQQRHWLNRAKREQLSAAALQAAIMQERNISGGNADAISTTISTEVHYQGATPVSITLQHRDGQHDDRPAREYSHDELMCINLNSALAFFEKDVLDQPPRKVSEQGSGT